MPAEAETSVFRRLLKSERRRRYADEVVFIADNPDIYAWARILPPLLPDEDRIKCSPVGEPVILSFPPSNKTVDQIRDEDIIGRIGRNPRKVVRIRYSRCNDTEDAIKFAMHAYMRYVPHGEERQGPLALCRLNSRLLQLYRMQNVTADVLPVVRDEMQYELASSGLEHNESIALHESIERFLKAMQGRDSTGRRNPMISRQNAALAWREAVRRLLVSKSVVTKYRDQLLPILIAVREDMLWQLASARETMSTQFGISFSNTGYRTDMTPPAPQDFYQKVAALRVMCRGLGSAVPFLPYRSTAFCIAYDLTGQVDVTDNNRKPYQDEVYTQLMGTELYEQVRTQQTVAQLSRQYKKDPAGIFSEVVNRCIMGTILIDNTFDLADERLADVNTLSSD